MTLQGKGFFIDQLSACEGGDPAAIRATAQAAGLSHVMLRIADGLDPSGIDSSGVDILAPVVQALHTARIAVWGWGTVYGDVPLGEAEVAAGRLQTLGLDGFVVRAGAGYKKPGRDKSAWVYLDALRRQVDLPVALSSYRFPHFHPEFPWATFLDLCDLHMPQVYWELAHDAGAQLRESKRQCDSLPNPRPYVPTGAAYGPVGSWAPDQADLADFLGAVRDLSLPAVNFYAWETCRANLPALWECIAAFRWGTVSQQAEGKQRTRAAATPPAGSAAARTPGLPTASKGGSLPGALQPAAPAEPDAFAIKFLTALNSRRPAKVASLYAAEATRVRADRILEGIAAIQADYQTFFAALPEDADFAFIRVGIQGVVRYLTWQAGPVNGLTTLVVQGGKIVQDYTLLE